MILSILLYMLLNILRSRLSNHFHIPNCIPNLF